MTEPTEPIEAETWKCAGCGVPSPGRMRSCDCATNVVYQPDQPGSASAWKLERYDAAPIEADIALLRGAIRISRDVRDNTVPVANDRLSRLLDYVEGLRARIRELEEALIKIRGWREIDRETLSERLTAIEEICSAALNGEKAAPTYATPAAPQKE